MASVKRTLPLKIVLSTLLFIQVFQRRLNEDFDFKRDWAGYESGFGKLNADFWLGNEKLHHMTESKLYMLRIDMETNDGRKLVATYNKFKIGQASDNYRLKSLGTYSGTEGNVCKVFRRGKMRLIS